MHRSEGDCLLAPVGAKRKPELVFFQLTRPPGADNLSSPSDLVLPFARNREV